MSKLKCVNNLNFRLPKEIVYKILSFLSIQDFVNLCISKVFLNTIITMPCLIENLIHSQNHFLCQSFKNENRFLLNCVFIPIILNKQFCFAIDTKKIYHFKMLSNFKNINIFLFKHILELFSFINLPFKIYYQYDDSAKKKLFYLLTKLGTCDKLCNCLNYHYYQYLNFEQYFKNKAKYYKKSCCYYA